MKATRIPEAAELQTVGTGSVYSKKRWRFQTCKGNGLHSSAEPTLLMMMLKCVNHVGAERQIKLLTEVTAGTDEETKFAIFIGSRDT
jgi:hypothetical protein